MNAEAEELCRLVNAMGYVQGYSWEREYDYVEDRIHPNVTLTFAPHYNHFGEKRLKVTFYDVTEHFISDNLFHMIAKIHIQIHDVTGEQWEDTCCWIEELEDHFSIRCRAFAYEWLPAEGLD